MAVLGQPGTLTARPVIAGADGSWQSAKAFWFDAAGYEINSKEVLDYHQSDARVRITTAPARTSKSYSAGHDPLPYCFPTIPDHDVLGWMVGPNYQTNKEFDILFDTLVQQRERFRINGALYEIERAVNNAKAGDMEIRILKSVGANNRKNRTRIIGKSATNPEALQGEQVTFAAMSEGAEQDEDIYEKYLKTRTWRLSIPTTPKQKAEWLRKLCDRGRMYPELGIDTFQYDGNANPDYDWDLFASAKLEAELRARENIGPNATAEDDPYFAEQFLGHWVYYTGRVLPFNEKRHLVAEDQWDPRQMRVMVSTDHGYEDAASAGFWAILPGPVYWRFDEVYERHLTTPDFVDAIQEKIDKWEVKVENYVGDPRKPEVERLMREAGMPIYTMDKNAQSDRAAGYRRLIDLLSQGPFKGFPGIFVSPRCVNTIREWKQLRYREGFRNEYSENAIMGDDHATDDSRYFLMTRPQPRHAQAKKLTEHERLRLHQKARAAYQRSDGSLTEIARSDCYAG